MRLEGGFDLGLITEEGRLILLVLRVLFLLIFVEFSLSLLVLSHLLFEDVQILERVALQGALLRGEAPFHHLVPAYFLW